MKLTPFLILTLAAAAQEPSVINTKPADPVIQQKDLWEASGWVHPFWGMPRFVLHDQAAVWTSPIHTARRDLKWWLIFGGVTVALVGTDRRFANELPNSKTQVSISNWPRPLSSRGGCLPQV